MSAFLRSIIFVAPFLLMSCVQEGKPDAETSEADPSVAALTDALAAAYSDLAEGATVVDWKQNVLQEGDNGFTCMPTPPAFKERGATAPMCFDDVWLEWADAWQNKKPFSADRIGIAYMLAGDGGASNIDPYAEGPTDDNDWIVEGPHLMLIAPNPALLEGIPTDPSSGGPYVMWRGTDYEHVMVPRLPPKSEAVPAPAVGGHQHGVAVDGRLAGRTREHPSRAAGGLLRLPPVGGRLDGRTTTLA